MKVECKGLICVYVRSAFVGVFTLIKYVLVALYFAFSMCVHIVEELLCLFLSNLRGCGLNAANAAKSVDRSCVNRTSIKKKKI